MYAGITRVSRLRSLSLMHYSQRVAEKDGAYSIGALLSRAWCWYRPAPVPTIQNCTRELQPPLSVLVLGNASSSTP